MRPQCMLSCFSHVQFRVTLWTIAHEAPLSMGFPRQEYWSELPCPLPGDLPHLDMKPMSLMSPISADGFFTTSTTWEALWPYCRWFNCSVVSNSCDHIDCSPPGASAHGILQTRISEWIAISFPIYETIRCVINKHVSIVSKHTKLV